MSRSFDAIGTGSDSSTLHRKSAIKEIKTHETILGDLILQQQYVQVYLGAFSVLYRPQLMVVC